jgi:hypothetical protein
LATRERFAKGGWRHRLDHFRAMDLDALHAVTRNRGVQAPRDSLGFR